MIRPVARQLLAPADEGPRNRGAGVWLCKGSDDTNCTLVWGACSYGNPDLTPFNSIKLVA